MVRCFVAGATGYVGREVVRELGERGARGRVIAHVRPDSPRLDAWRARFAAASAEVDTTAWDAAALAEALRRHAITHVLCLIGTTRERARRDGLGAERYQAIDLGLTRILGDAAVASGTRPHLTYLSSIGADPGARSAYLRARGEAEAVIRSLGLPYLIVRPSFITGPDRDEARPGERVAAAATDGVLAAMAFLGARRLRRRWASVTGAGMAHALVVLAVERGIEGVVDGEAIYDAMSS